MLEEKNMKKLFAILLSVSLVMSVAVLFSSAAPEKASLTAQHMRQRKTMTTSM